MLTGEGYSPLMDLPQELVEHIISQLSNDQKALRACARLSRRFVAKAQEILFSQWAPSYLDSTSTIRSIEQLAFTLDQSPHLATHIRQFCILIGPLEAGFMEGRFLNSHLKARAQDYPQGVMPLITRMLPLLSKSPLRALSIRPLCGEKYWDYSSSDLRVALRAFLKDRVLHQLSIFMIRRMDFGILGDMVKIHQLQVYATSASSTTQYIPAFDSNLALESHPIPPQPAVCAIESLTYNPSSITDYDTFIEHCFKKCLFPVIFLGITSLHVRDETRDPPYGPNPLNLLFPHISKLLELEVSYEGRISSQWKPPDLALLPHLSTLRFNITLDTYRSKVTHHRRLHQIITVLSTLPVNLAAQPLSKLAVKNDVLITYGDRKLDWTSMRDDWNAVADHPLIELLPNLTCLDVEYESTGMFPETAALGGTETWLPELRAAGVKISVLDNLALPVYTGSDYDS